jgi:hypothetical protein
MRPLQFGVPGGPEIIVVLVVFLLLLAIPLGAGYWIGRDASRRGSDHGLAWGTMTFLSGMGSFFTFVPFVIFYFVVRDDLGTG